MSDITKPARVDITVQVACVQRELGYRRRVYPRLVAAGKMTQQKADAELAAMQAVLETLEKLAAEERPTLFQ